MSDIEKSKEELLLEMQELKNEYLNLQVRFDQQSLSHKLAEESQIKLNALLLEDLLHRIHPLILKYIQIARSDY